MTGNELKAEITDVFFTCDVLEFRECFTKKFANSSSAKKFLRTYLVAECQLGGIHTPEQLSQCYQEIEKRLRKNSKKDEEKIFSEDLPLNPSKKEKSLDNVYYVRIGDTCSIKGAKNPPR